MPEPISMLAIGGGSLLSGGIQAGTSLAAADMQRDEARAARHMQEQQFQQVQQLLSPYVQAGQGAIAGLQPYQQAGLGALQQQQALLGLGGADQQQQAMQALQSDPAFMAMAQQGEGAILQNAAATGGLRGGNAQAALGQFRPQLLNQFLQQRMASLGGLVGLGQSTTQGIAGLGQASAAGVGAAGQQSASAIGNLMQQQGAASAGGLLGAGQAIGNTVNQGIGGLLAYRALGQSPGAPGAFGVAGPQGYNMAGGGAF